MYSLFCESLNKVQMKLTSITPTLMLHLVCLILDWLFYYFVNKWQIIAAVGFTVKHVLCVYLNEFIPFYKVVLFPFF